LICLRSSRFGQEWLRIFLTRISLPYSVVIVAPVETVKTKCIEMNKAFIEGLKFIITTEGFRGIYQGGIATALKQGTNQGFRFMWFNEYKRIVTKDGQVPLSPIGGLLGGMSAGCFSVRLGGVGSCPSVATIIFNSYRGKSNNFRRYVIIRLM
jgi:Mitochondrial carrier protein